MSLTASPPRPLNICASPRRLHRGTRRRAVGWAPPAPLLVLSLALVVCCTGCQTTGRPRAKDTAEKPWDAVRARVKLQLAEKHLQGGLFEDAARDALEATALHPVAPEPYVILARARLGLGDVGGAEVALASARTAGADSPMITYTEGITLEQRGRIDDALERYTAARLADPRQIDFWVACAECLAALDREDEALALIRSDATIADHDSMRVLAARLESATSADPGPQVEQIGPAMREHPVVAEHFARQLVREHRFDEAIAMVDGQTATTAGDKAAPGAVVRTLTKAELGRGDSAAALAAISDYARKTPDDLPAQRLYAMSLMASGDAFGALAVLGRLQAANEPPDVTMLRATALWKCNRGNEARALLEPFVVANPSDSAARCLLAEILIDLSEPSAAEAQLGAVGAAAPAADWSRNARERLARLRN